MDKTSILKNQNGFSLDHETSILNNLLAKTDVDLAYIQHAL